MAEETRDTEIVGDYRRSAMSTNADDVIPAAAMAPPAEASAVDDVIPPHSLIETTPSMSAWDATKGVLSTVRNTALNIPYGIVHGVGDLVRKVTGNNEAPESGIETALNVEPDDENQKKLGLKVGEFIKNNTNELPNQADDTAIPEFSEGTRSVLGHTLAVAGDVGNILAPISIGKGLLAKAPAAVAPALEGAVPEAATERAGILQRVGIENARNSALTQDAKGGATDFQLSKFDEPAGQAAKAQFDAEKEALNNNAHSIIDDTGGTVGTDEDTLNSRGQTIAAPFDKLRTYFENQKKAAYSAADERAAGKPISSLSSTSNLLKDPDFTETLMAKDQGGLLNSIQRQFQRFQALNPEGMTVENAENFRKWLNQVWTPENSATLGKVKGALDDDVFRNAGEDIYGPARKIVQTEAQTLDNPNGVSKLMDFDPQNPLNRTTPHAKIPDTLTRLDPAQFDNVIKTLDTMPEAIQPEAQAAKAEIKAHLANKIADAGSSTQGQWDAPAVSKVIKANSAKIQSAFADQPEALQKIQDLDSAGKILKVDQSYPGAAAQAANILKRGAMSNVIGKGGAIAGGSIGGTAGAILAGSPGAVAGTTAGATIGGGLSGKASQALAERSALKKWQAGTTKLSGNFGRNRPNENKQ